jgi:hypothetical protein
VAALDKEISMYKAALAKVMEELYDPEGIYIQLPNGSTVHVKEDELMEAITDEYFEGLKTLAAKYKRVAFEVALMEAQQINEKLAKYRKETYKELVEEDKKLRALREQLAEMFRDTIRSLEQKRAAALGQGGESGFKPDTGDDLEASKKAMGLELDKIRQAGFWHPTNHQQAGIAIGRSKTFEQLGWAETLIGEWAACYNDVNAKLARIAAANKAGRYPNPGARIGDEDRAKAARNQCIESAWVRYNARFKR